MFKKTKRTNVPLISKQIFNLGTFGIFETRKPKGYWAGKPQKWQVYCSGFSVVLRNTTAHEFEQIKLALSKGASANAILTDLAQYRKKRNGIREFKPLKESHIHHMVGWLKLQGELSSEHRNNGKQVTGRARKNRNTAVILS